MPTPMVLTEIPCCSNSRPSLANSSGRRGPTLAWPSESSTTRLSRRASRLCRTCAAPSITPPWIAVDPRAVDLPDAIDEGGMVVDRLRLHQDVDLVVEDDDRGDVVLVETADGGGRGLARLRDPRALHRAGAVDHEGDVHGVRSVGWRSQPLRPMRR